MCRPVRSKSYQDTLGHTHLIVVSNSKCVKINKFPIFIGYMKVSYSRSLIELKRAIGYNKLGFTPSLYFVTSECINETFHETSIAFIQFQYLQLEFTTAKRIRCVFHFACHQSELKSVLMAINLLI